uniref:Short-chain dehydrogenase/reductase n=2 Tax=Opuntia streptacantha TaxID=393608 RepID=A0A7C8Z8B4_OPUST
MKIVVGVSLCKYFITDFSSTVFCSLPSFAPPTFAGAVMADEASNFLSETRYAVVTGANKGIGLEICRQLASQGVVVVLTARNESRGREAFENLKKSGIPSDSLEFHRLDVTDSSSIASLADFINAKFGKLDILVNNAGIAGFTADFDAMRAAGFGTPGVDPSKFSGMMKLTYELAEECIKTNYYGVKATTEALLPLLQLSDSPRIVNVSSSAGLLKNIPSERVRGILGNVESLTEETIDEVLNEFLKDFKEGSLETKGWPSFFPAYSVSKAALNAYTRILAKKYPSIIINCLCPGYVKTDINGNTGVLTVEEGGASCVRLALLPHGSPSGLFYFRNEVSSF